MSNLQWLSEFYASRCDGEWESDYGINIETVNNPGWMVRIDLDGTGLDPDGFVPIAQQRTPTNWVECKVADGVFLGGGGLENLDEVIGIFRQYVEGKPVFPEKPRRANPAGPKQQQRRGPGPRGRN